MQETIAISSNLQARRPILSSLSQIASAPNQTSPGVASCESRWLRLGSQASAAHPECARSPISGSLEPCARSVLEASAQVAAGRLLAASGKLPISGVRVAMPSQDHLRSTSPPSADRGTKATEPGQDGTIGRPQLWPIDLTAQHPKLVPQKSNSASGLLTRRRTSARSRGMRSQE